MPHAIRSFSQAIIHIDGDAFFASCEQSLNPALKGKPVITGTERGIASSLSYEAKALGIERGMSLREIKKRCPEIIMLPSDYETYSLLSKRFFDIVRRYTHDVEEYGIDECFADITGMRRPLRKSYPQIAEAIQSDLWRELGFTFSVGLAPTKVLAKAASKWKKPSGLTVIPTQDIERYLSILPVRKIWGIGHQTTELLKKYGIITAGQFIERPLEWIEKRFSKPFQEIWHELRGISVMPLIIHEKSAYQSIQKVKTFTPPSSDRAFVFAQLSKNIENACIKLRRYHQAAHEVTFFLRLQNFSHKSISVRFQRPSAYPTEVIAVAEKVFDEMFNSRLRYRMTGVMLNNLTSDEIMQPDLFGGILHYEKLSRAFESVDELARRFGKHTVFVGSSFNAHQSAQRAGNRQEPPRRRNTLFKDETRRRRLGIPMFSQEVL